MITTQTNTKKFIWYNPISELYESGSILDYEKVALPVEKEADFSLILKFNQRTQHLTERIINELNNART